MTHLVALFWLRELGTVQVAAEEEKEREEETMEVVKVGLVTEFVENKIKRLTALHQQLQVDLLPRCSVLVGRNGLGSATDCSAV